jgi:ribosomal protein S27E
MHRTKCYECGHDGPIFIVVITDDYVLVQCPFCQNEWTMAVGMDLE